MKGFPGHASECHIDGAGQAAVGQRRRLGHIRKRPFLTAPALEEMGLLQPVGTIAHLWPSTQRALFVRNVNNGLGVHYRVARGENFQTPGIVPSKEPVVPHHELRKAAIFESGIELFDRVAMASEPGTLQIALAGGFHDLHALLFGDKERAALFQKAVSSVVLMSGIELEDHELGIPKLDANGFMIPDGTGNNTYDIDKTKAVYRRLQELGGIQMIIVTRDAGYEAGDVGDDGLTVDQFWRRLAATGHPTARMLVHPTRTKARDEIIDAQWSQVFLAGDVRWFPQGPNSRPRDVNWFVQTQISSEARRNEALRRGAIGKVHDLVSEVHHNTLTQLAGIPYIRERLFRPRMITINGTLHMVIGIGKGHGIHDARQTTDFILKLAVAGLELSMSKSVAEREQIIQSLFEALGAERTPDIGASVLQ